MAGERGNVVGIGYLALMAVSVSAAASDASAERRGLTGRIDCASYFQLMSFAAQRKAPQGVAPKIVRPRERPRPCARLASR